MSPAPGPVTTRWERSPASSSRANPAANSAQRASKWARLARRGVWGYLRQHPRDRGPPTQPQRAPAPRAPRSTKPTTATYRPPPHRLMHSMAGGRLPSAYHSRRRLMARRHGERAGQQPRGEAVLRRCCSRRRPSGADELAVEARQLQPGLFAEVPLQQGGIRAVVVQRGRRVPRPRRPAPARALARGQALGLHLHRFAHSDSRCTSTVRRIGSRPNA